MYSSHSFPAQKSLSSCRSSSGQPFTIIRKRQSVQLRKVVTNGLRYFAVSGVNTILNCNLVVSIDSHDFNPKEMGSLWNTRLASQYNLLTFLTGRRQSE